MKNAILTLAAGSALAMHTLVLAAEPGRSLQERRLEVLNGTAPGIVLFGSKRPPQAPAAAASSASAAGTARPAALAQGEISASGAKPAAPASPAVPLFWAEPPSGKALNDARRLDSPTQGIALPVAGGAASQAAGKEPPKPGR